MGGVRLCSGLSWASHNRDWLTQCRRVRAGGGHVMIKYLVITGLAGWLLFEGSVGLIAKVVSSYQLHTDRIERVASR